MEFDGEWRRMGQMARFQDTLRRLAIFDGGFVEARFGLGLAEPSALDAQTAALPQLAVSVAIGNRSPSHSPPWPRRPPPRPPPPPPR